MKNNIKKPKTSKKLKKRVHLEGKTIHKLTVLKEVTEDINEDSYFRYWECECECGKKVVVRQDKLTKTYKKHTLSCGCYYESNKDLTNQKFGKLTALERQGFKHGSIVWKCVCECGNTCYHTTSNLTTLKTMSCGCNLNLKGKDSRKYRGCGLLSGYTWSIIKASARARNLAFDININEAWELFVSQNGKCALSGVDIVLYDSRTQGKNTASLDRIDSKKGYVIDNIQWVHRDVNYMKQEYDSEYFLSFIEKIYNKHKNNIEYKPKINQVDYFIGIAILISARSMDAQTQHGCVITDINNHIVGTGYNSFAKNLPDDVLPNLRPSKYDFMIHSEVNAVTNMVISPACSMMKYIAYITGKPCFKCLQHLHNNNISKIYYLDGYGWSNDDKEKEMWEDFVQLAQIDIEAVNVDLGWIRKRLNDFSETVFNPDYDTTPKLPLIILENKDGV